MNNQPRVNIMDWFGGKDCYWLRFRVNGKYIEGMDDASIMVDFNIFLNPDVPINGIRQIRIFYLEQYEGNWIRTHPTEQTTFRTLETGVRKSRPFQNYYKEHPWTKLYSYIYGDSSNKEDESNISTQSIKKGDRVLVRYKETKFWYVATTLELSGDRIKIEWYDGDGIFWMDKSRVKPFFWRVGIKIVAKDPWFDVWKSCEIRSLSGDSIKVLFYDADFPVEIDLGQCRSEGL